MYDTIVRGISDAIEQGVGRLQPAALSWSETVLPLTEHVAFNRSLRAYNRNPGIERLTKANAARGVDRSMLTLRADATDGTPLGSFHWFGVHGCSCIPTPGRYIRTTKGLPQLP